MRLTAAAAPPPEGAPGPLHRGPAAGGPPGGIRGVPAAALRGRALLGAAAPWVRRPACPRPPGGPRPRGPRRQPHGAHVHRRPERRLALRRAPPHGVREPADVAASRRRPEAPRPLHHGRHPPPPAPPPTHAARGGR